MKKLSERQELLNNRERQKSWKSKGWLNSLPKRRLQTWLRKRDLKSQPLTRLNRRDWKSYAKRHRRNKLRPKLMPRGRQTQKLNDRLTLKKRKKLSYRKQKPIARQKEKSKLVRNSFQPSNERLLELQKRRPKLSRMLKQRLQKKRQRPKLVMKQMLSALLKQKQELKKQRKRSNSSKRNKDSKSLKLKNLFVRLMKI